MSALWRRVSAAPSQAAILLPQLWRSVCEGTPQRIPRPDTRKVERPSYDQLLREIEETSYLAVGRKYCVSDNAIRKWVRWYEREVERRGAESEIANSSQLTMSDL
jgi:hypothetical protein